MAQLESKRDQPGTQREYETIFILTPNADSDQIRDINGRIRRIIEGENGSLVRVENWGKRKLAYQIRNNSRGIYMYWRYLSPPPLVAEVERNLRMLDPVIRYMTIKLDENIDPAARPSDLSDEAFDAAATTIPDEEDIAMGRVDRGSDDGEKAAAPATEAAEKTEAAPAAEKAEAAVAPAAEKTEAPAAEKAEATPETTDAKEAPEAATEEADAGQEEKK